MMDLSSRLHLFMRSARSVWLFVVATALLGTAAASQTASVNQGPAELPQGNAHLQPFDNLRYLISDDAALDPDAVLARRNEFKPLESPWVDFGEQQGAVWLLVEVTNSADRSGRWMIDIQRPFADELIVQKRGAGQPVETLLSVDRQTPFQERPVVSQYLVAPLWMEAGETAEILVGLRSSTGTWMPLTFATEERMRTAHMQEARTNWIINGAMAALVIIAIAMGRLVGWPLVGSFAAYVSLSALFVANNEGYLHRFWWPGSMGAYEPANLLLLCGMMIAVLQFARLFAGLKAHSPRFNRGIIGLQAVLGLLAVLCVFLWQLDAVSVAVFAIVPVVAIAYFAIAILAWRAKTLGAIPFTAGSIAILFTVVTMGAVLAVPGRFPLTVALDYFHATVLIESVAFLIAILVRMLAMQADLNRSLQAEVNAANERLELSEALEESRARYDTARTQADGLRNRLASTSHDLQQPLMSLRQSLADVARRDPQSAGALQTALDYLQNVTDAGLEAAVSDSDLSGEKPEEGDELFPVGLVLENCATMFRADAKQRGIDLRVRSSDTLVKTEPIEFMRAVSNLVSNALRHSKASTVLVAAQTRPDHVLVRVLDNGCGMGSSLPSKVRASPVEAEHSKGHGLGLKQVQNLASRPGHSLKVRSAVDEGTCVTLVIPRS
ncbi:sensor histidine kinase [Erythrobacter sp. F6033]|uniref:sensor histidine kinase n=1 Tax=Erythrobacter sp. F6033 TaxID=2926401 RepID=UPI001FF5A50D|nr:sensor histidine kinase [Erythrobacter sp. F6033]MCK0129364.1 sensor histidine kinase [Erythrobacter sp. F6033]